MEARSALIASVLAVFAFLAGPASASARDADDSGAGEGAVAAPRDCEGRPSNTRLTVQVGQLKSGQGEVAITVYPSDPQRFLAPRGKLLRVRVKAVAPTTQACFYLPGPDAYAVAVYHDANANRGFDRNAVGMPVEGFAFSNDAPTKFGVPSFDAARFTVKAGETVLRVKMRYAR
jgi:uncharacterized protein (DUF2141 family)